MKHLYSLIIALAITTLAHAQQAQINLVLVAPTGFNSPVDIKHCGDNRIFVVEQQGVIRIMDKNGNINPTAFLNITDRVNSSGNEQGLLGLAFSPNYKQDGYLYVNYTTGSSAGSTRISRFSVSQADSNVAVLGSEKILLSFTQPYTNHNGGGMLFGKDGYLYVSQGDGGSGGDPAGNGQSLNTLLGKILRLDVSNADTTYMIPPSNPFVGQPNTKPEIWAYGVRNPWRVSFDRLTGDFWMADVGQDAYEEIDFQAASSTGGENYGWRCREGMFACSNCNTSGCPVTGFTDPVFSYSQTEFSSCSVTGGYVYRGAQYSNLFGKYIFADYCSGRFWSIKPLGNGQFDPDTLQDFTNFQYTSFGEDNNGELYLAYRGSGTGGRIYRVTDGSDCKPVAFIASADTLSTCGSATVSALYGDTLQYQWYSSTGIVNGANSYMLTVQNEGWYKVQVSKAQAGCSAMSDSVFIRINQATPITENGPTPVLCRAASAASLVDYVAPIGGTFSGAHVSGNSFNPANADTLNTVLYTYVNEDGCTSIYQLPVRVGDATPLTVNIASMNYCSDDAAFSLSDYVSPLGGTYSGTGVSNNNFDPSTVTIGTYPVTYTYFNSYGCTSVDSVEILVEQCTDINDIDKGLAVSVYPNPNNGVFNINVSSSHIQKGTLSISDATGREVFKKELTLNAKQSIAAPQLSKGVYTINLIGEKGRAVNRIVVE